MASGRLDPEPLGIAWQAGELHALVYGPADVAPGLITLVLAHGAGAGQTHPFVVSYARGLASRGIEILTFNFPYIERGRRVPDRAERLEACYLAVIEAARERVTPTGGRLAIGGKSMGGRVASQLVAKNERASRDLLGLVALGYPLHPPGKPERPRVAHLPDVPCPMLFVQGARDGFGTPDELAPVVHTLGPRAMLHVVKGADHSFTVPRSWPVSQADVHEGIQEAVAHWLLAVRGERRAQHRVP